MSFSSCFFWPDSAEMFRSLMKSLWCRWADDYCFRLEKSRLLFAELPGGSRLDENCLTVSLALLVEEIAFFVVSGGFLKLVRLSSEKRIWLFF